MIQLLQGAKETKYKSLNKALRFKTRWLFRRTVCRLAKSAVLWCDCVVPTKDASSQCIICDTHRGSPSLSLLHMSEISVLCIPLILNNVNTNIRDAAGAAQISCQINLIEIIIMLIIHNSVAILISKTITNCLEQTNLAQNRATLEKLNISNMK